MWLAGTRTVVLFRWFGQNDDDVSVALAEVICAGRHPHAWHCA